MLISPFTVNDTTEQLKKLFTRAKAWGVRFDHEPVWRDHWLDEPQERVRELHDDEGDRLDAAMRDDLAPFFAFAKASGLRLRECLLRWSEVDWECRPDQEAREGRQAGHGADHVDIREILWPLRDHDPEHVFTYLASDEKEGEWPALSAHLFGRQHRWRRLRKRPASPASVSRLPARSSQQTVRETGNLKLVQRALNHADIKTTTRYAHVSTRTLQWRWIESAESRKKSRSKVRKVG